MGNGTINTVLQLVHEVEAAGGRIAVNGDRLKLSAPGPLPNSLIDELRQHKAEVIGLLVGSQWTGKDWKHFYGERAAVLEHNHELPRAEAEARAWEWCIIEWLNQNPVPSEHGRCVWCDGPVEAGETVVLPLGTNTHRLHPHCWQPWYQQRCNYAHKALAEVLGGFIQ